MSKLISLLLIAFSCTATSLFGQETTMKNMRMANNPASDNAKTIYPVTGKVRTYYIAADEVVWDYIPGDKDIMTGKPFTGIEKLYTEQDSVRIGKRYLKAIYREYTDSTFTVLKKRPADQAYLGILGPIIRAEVGDVIHVTFRNNASRPYSMHPHGVFYDKSSEGALYDKDKIANSVDGNAVPPGGTFNYVWEVPKRAGPGPNDPSSVVWLYHSHVVEPKDVNAGLVGAIIVSVKGTTRPDGTPKDVDREFVNLFIIFDENSSWYLDQNIKTSCKIKDSLNKAKIDFPSPAGVLTIQNSNNASTFLPVGFTGANFRFTINGYSFGTMPMMTMKKGERIRWYLLALGNGINFHTPHWHGNTVISNGQRTDVIALMPAQMVVANMIPDNPGMWMFHCHVDDHMESGMMAMYEVLP